MKMLKILHKNALLLILSFAFILFAEDSMAQSGCGSWSGTVGPAAIWEPSGVACPACVSATDDNWDNPANWNTGSVPSSATNVYIPGNCSPQPRLYITKDCRTITIASDNGAVLTWEGTSAILNVHGSF